jgi:hypothetical protein
LPEYIAELIGHYRLKEMTDVEPGRKAHSTRAAYECYLDGWIIPRWGDHRLAKVKSVAVEEWLGSIERTRGTKAKIRNIMSALQSRNAVRMDGQKSDQTRAAKREEGTHTRRT